MGDRRAVCNHVLCDALKPAEDRCENSYKVIFDENRRSPLQRCEGFFIWEIAPDSGELF